MVSLSPTQSRPPLGRDFWCLWSASGVSNLADGLFKVALPLLALTVTRSPGLVAGVMAALTLPWLLFALPAGALVDRVDRRRLMLAANLARAAVLGSLVATVALGAASIWALYAIALAAGVAEVLYDAAAQTIVPRVVPRGQLTRANGRLFAAELTANEFLGPPLGGLLMTVGAVVAFATPAGLWLLAVGVLVLLRGSFRVTRTTRTAVRADIAEGLRLLWGSTVLRALAVMTGVFNLASGATMAVLVVYAVGPGSAMGLGEAGYGLLLTATAAGSVTGTFVAAGVERRLGRSRAMGVGLAGATLFVGVPALSADAFVVASGFFVGGVGLMVWNVVAVSLRQRITPDAMLGRITGAHRLFAWGSKPVGALVGGLIAEIVGLRAVFAVMGVLVLALLILVRRLGDGTIAAEDEHGGQVA